MSKPQKALFIISAGSFGQPYPVCEGVWAHINRWGHGECQPVAGLLVKTSVCNVQFWTGSTYQAVLWWEWAGESWTSGWSIGREMCTVSHQQNDDSRRHESEQDHPETVKRAWRTGRLMPEAGQGRKRLHRRLRTQLEREKNSRARPMPSKPRNFQESIISNFPLNSRILWSQLTVVMISGFAKRLTRKGKVQRFLEVDTLVSFNI